MNSLRLTRKTSDEELHKDLDNLNDELQVFGHQGTTLNRITYPRRDQGQVSGDLLKDPTSGFGSPLQMDLG